MEINVVQLFGLIMQKTGILHDHSRYINFRNRSCGRLNGLGPVVLRSSNPMHWINIFPVDSATYFVNTCRLDSDLSV